MLKASISESFLFHIYKKGPLPEWVSQKITPSHIRVWLECGLAQLGPLAIGLSVWRHNRNRCPWQVRVYMLRMADCDSDSDYFVAESSTEEGVLRNVNDVADEEVCEGAVHPYLFEPEPDGSSEDDQEVDENSAQFGSN